MRPYFHLSLMVSDLGESRRFYETILNAKIGRVTDRWLDLWLFGAQVTIQQAPAGAAVQKPSGKFHLGATLAWEDWLKERARFDAAGVAFAGAPVLNEEAGTAKLYLNDPDGYMIELKAYKDVEAQLSPQTAAS